MTIATTFTTHTGCLPQGLDLSEPNPVSLSQELEELDQSATSLPGFLVWRGKYLFHQKWNCLEPFFSERG